MKKQVLFILTVSSLTFSSKAQVNSKISPCNTFNEMENVFKNDPSAKKRFDEAQVILKNNYENKLLNNTSQKAAAISYTIPVVFHILHQNGSEKIGTAQVNDAITIFNRDYNKQNADTSAVISSFKPIIGDVKLTFKLAAKDPNGNCTNGIIYHETPATNWDNSNFSLYAYTGASTGRWNPTKYLNIYVVKTINSGAAGYTFLPGTWPTGAQSDAIVILSTYVGSIGTGNSFTSRALTHEIGHWLNLKHTWGGTNNPLVACGDDGITDTPITEGYTTCPTASTSKICNPLISENYQNYMDYSYCSVMFTSNQATAMQNALSTTISGRNNLSSPANLVFTGITPGYTCTPLADLTSSKTTICSGSSITYTDMSQYGGTGSIAWVFEGGSPATSTAVSPVVTYNTPGTYSVSLTATNAYGSNTLSKVSYITVVNSWSSYSSPVSHDFESGLFPWLSLVTNANPGSGTWQINNTNGAIGTAFSIYLNNASQLSTPNHLDIFETPAYDFHTTTGISMSYYYAYAKKSATQADTFKLQISTDCGGTWKNVVGYASCTTMALNSAGITATPLIPTPSQWKQQIISSSFMGATSPNPNLKQSVKFRFYFRSDDVVGSSNNLYIDQINLSGVVGINEFENSIGLSIYPNPTNSSSTVDFNIYNKENVKIKIIDLTGRIIEETDKIDLNGNQASYTINKNGQLAKGLYFINLEINNNLITKKIIIQ
jgi:PKD repeat protein